MVHHVVEQSFDSLCKDRVRVLLCGRKEAKKQTRLWMGAAAKRLAKWKAACLDAEASSNYKCLVYGEDVVVLSNDDDA